MEESGRTRGGGSHAEWGGGAELEQGDYAFALKHFANQGTELEMNI